MLSYVFVVLMTNWYSSIGLKLEGFHNVPNVNIIVRYNSASYLGVQCAVYRSKH